MPQILRDAGAPTGGGDLNSPLGQRITNAIEQPCASPGGTAPGNGVDPRAPFPPCQGTFDDTAATVTLQQSPVFGIPWLVRLKPELAYQGTINFQAQIFADNRQANVYQPHVEPWDYNFHGPLPRTFQVIGDGNYTMHAGSEVSFLWYWTSITHSGSGGYAFNNCVYSG
ncbi:hypothetical protein [Nocardia terpenica]|uniref:hypothetical protein n=1 Tax=Nocardia terpenica TaxID=455432 RepID=UPI0012E72075|nr:hypothetical protein [Nocardia terpenica]NQE88759.1 hypothetical protein [Nocardia terpenica]